MKSKTFKYKLPKERIAQFPPRKRGMTKLLVVDRKTKRVKHKKYSDVVKYMKKGDKYYITEGAHLGVDDKDDYSTDCEDFYYCKVYTEGSKYYNDNFDNYKVPLVERGDDLAWIGPIWIHPQG